MIKDYFIGIYKEIKKLFKEEYIPIMWVCIFILCLIFMFINPLLFCKILLSLCFTSIVFLLGFSLIYECLCEGLGSKNCNYPYLIGTLIFVLSIITIFLSIIVFKGMFNLL